MVNQIKINTAEASLVSATTKCQKKKANRSKRMIEQYGTSCFLQLLDNEAAPTENRSEDLKKKGWP